MIDYSVNRNFMKSKICDLDFKLAADIALGVPQPAFEKLVSKATLIINLPEIICQRGCGTKK